MPASSHASLPSPRTAAGADGLREFVGHPATAMLALDFDGTLAPIVADPAAARPYPGASAALERLARQLGTVAIVTGRPAALAAELLGVGPQHPTNLLILGLYGLQRWTPSGGLAAVDVDRAPVEAARAALAGVLARLDLPPGVSVEDKEESLAVHVRRAADPQRALTVLRTPLADLAREHGLRLEPGRMVLELRPPGTDKGAALERLAAERSARAVGFAGDDLGDLAAFDAVDRLRAAGLAGFTVCSGSDEVAELARRADVVVDGPAGVVRLIDALADAIG